MNRLKPISVVVTTEEGKRLKLLAALDEKTVSTFIRDLLIEHTELGNDSFFANGVPSKKHSKD